MFTWAILLISSACCQATENSTTSLELTASTELPFVGELVQLTLSIGLPSEAVGSPELPRLIIPWLDADYDWAVSPAFWWEKQRAHCPGQPVLINDDPRPIVLCGIPSQATGKPAGSHSNQFKLSWSLAAPAIDDINQGVVRFAPVKLLVAGRAILSRPLELRLRPVPAALRSIPRMNLGVGSYIIRPEVDPRTVELGSEARLTLRVSGKGDLRNIPQPTSAQLVEALPPSDFIVSSAGESWSDDRTERRFHYDVKPRRVDIDQIPRIPYTCFDPFREEWLLLAAGPVRITMRPPANAAPRQSMAVKGPVPERLRFGDVSLATLSRRDWSVSAWVFILFACAPPLLWLALWVGLQSKRASFRAAGITHPARKALERLAKVEASMPEALSVIFLAYCRSRFRLLLSEPTGAELERHLIQAGVPQALANEAASWWNDLAAARFAAGDVKGSSALVENARCHILALDRVDQ